jgi:hypothetical protein
MFWVLDRSYGFLNLVAVLYMNSILAINDNFVMIRMAVFFPPDNRITRNEFQPCGTLDGIMKPIGLYRIVKASF